MFKSITITVILILSITFRLRAQSFTIMGRIQDSSDNSALVGAAVQLISQSDTLQRKVTFADEKGDFSFQNLKKDTYTLKAVYTGYERTHIKVIADKAVKNIGIIKMRPADAGLKEVEIVGHESRMQQKGDTLQYNADAFKTNPDADAEDLLAKMPGITIDNGTVKAHGEQIQQILLDGRPYFGGDLNAALKNIPAETIDKIQVYYKPSDQAQFTGIDDGQSIKIINIITRPDKRNGAFGKTTLNYGTANHYLADENLNIFDGSRRITVSGASGNATNGSQGGVNVTNRGGLNYADSLGRKTYLTGSYALNSTRNTVQSALTRTYFGALDNTAYNESTYAKNNALSNNLNLRLETMIDSQNTLTLTSGTQLGSGNGNSYRNAANTMAGQLQSQEQNLNLDRNGSYSIGNNLLYGHRFRKKGRTASLNLSTSFNHNTSADTLHANTNRYTGGADSISAFNQRSQLLAGNYTIAPNLSYTEPLSKRSMLQLSAGYSFTYSQSAKNTYNYDPVSQEYNRLDTTLSSKYNVNTTYYTSGLSYHTGNKKYNLNAGVNYQDAILKGAAQYPSAFDIDKQFVNLLPRAIFNYRFSAKNNLNISYQAATRLPGIFQLQNTINNSNPLLLSSGNPDLRQQYTHTLSARLGIPVSKNNSLYFNLSAARVMHVVSTATSIATKDSLLPQGYLMQKGAQLSRPVNLEGSHNARGVVTYSMPLDKIKSNLNFNFGLSYTSMPGLINNALNFANTYSLSSGITLSSNRSKGFDYTLSSDPGYNIVKNTLVPQQNNNYYFQTNSLRINWIIWKGLVLNTDANYRIYTGLNSSYQQNLLIWNASLGKKLFKKQNGELRLYVYDLLNQNQSLSRIVTDTYVQDRQANVLGRIYMVSFVYNLRNYMPAK
jgi:hypothetical protein